MWRELTRSSEVRGSDHPLEFVEGRSKGEPRTCIAPEFVVASPKVLDEGMASDYDAGRSVLFQSAHRAKSGLESPMIVKGPKTRSGAISVDVQRGRRVPGQGDGLP